MIVPTGVSWDLTGTFRMTGLLLSLMAGGAAESNAASDMIEKRITELAAISSPVPAAAIASRRR